jgi:mono/diheme cytochrome c family protein
LTIIVAIALVWRIDFISPNSSAVMVEPETIQNYKPSSADSVKQKYIAGKSYFKSNCAACHNPKVDGTGPPLMGVSDRWNAAGNFKGKTGEQWLKLWIRNWREVVSSGYPYAIQMANSRASEMNIFSTIRDEDIDDLLFYVNQPDVIIIQPQAIALQSSLN